MSLSKGNASGPQHKEPTIPHIRVSEGSKKQLYSRTADWKDDPKHAEKYKMGTIHLKQTPKKYILSFKRMVNIFNALGWKSRGFTIVLQSHLD